MWPASHSALEETRPASLIPRWNWRHRLRVSRGVSDRENLPGACRVFVRNAELRNLHFVAVELDAMARPNWSQGGVPGNSPAPLAGIPMGKGKCCQVGYTFANQTGGAACRAKCHTLILA